MNFFKRLRQIKEQQLILEKQQTLLLEAILDATIQLNKNIYNLLDELAKY